MMLLPVMLVITESFEVHTDLFLHHLITMFKQD
jgi:hypothetical protein